MEKMTDREVLQSIVDAYDFRSELFTSDEDCAGNLADRARKQLAAAAPLTKEGIEVKVGQVLQHP